MSIYRIRRAIRRALDFITGATTRREIERLERIIQRLLDENYEQFTRINALEMKVEAPKRKPATRRKK